MARPKEIWIGERRVPIVFRKQVFYKNERLCGKYDYEPPKIWVALENSPTEQRSTLYHEIRHALLDIVSGIPDTYRADVEEWTAADEKMFFPVYVDPRNGPVWDWIRFGASAHACASD